jgi:hypothetical protein
VPDWPAGGDIDLVNELVWVAVGEVVELGDADRLEAQ